MSIGVLLLVLVIMLIKVAPYFHRVRRADGLEIVDGKWERSVTEPSSEEMGRLIAALNPAIVTAVGVAGWAVIVWLMLFKPF